MLVGLALPPEPAGTAGPGAADAVARPGAWTLTALLNTRGLTEIVVLQAGHSAHIRTPGLCVALLVMALATTACSGPLLWAADRCARSAAAHEPARPPAGNDDHGDDHSDDHVVVRRGSAG
ncbi:hypothetical protein [Streptomyces camelliae]|uniref:hypothetical protein n=1 Tax=Streptomyces camelliae TaxID=3004093 RepID=UPI002FD8401E